MQLSSEAAEKAGYHICPYCDGMDALFRMKKEQILKYARKNHMEVDLLNHVLYVRTDVGCWKMIYSMSEQRFLLYHKNYMQECSRLMRLKKELIIGKEMFLFQKYRKISFI